MREEAKKTAGEQRTGARRQQRRRGAATNIWRGAQPRQRRHHIMVVMIARLMGARLGTKGATGGYASIAHDRWQRGSGSW